jgi:hypothetical protein
MMDGVNINHWDFDDMLDALDPNHQYHPIIYGIENPY